MHKNIITYETNREGAIIRMNKTRITENLGKYMFMMPFRNLYYLKAIIELQNNTGSGTSETAYPSNKILIEHLKGSKDNKWKNVLSHLKKLGVIIKHNGYLYLNPLIIHRDVHKLREMALEYYTILWSEEFRNNIEVKSKGEPFIIKPIEDLKKEYAEFYQNLIKSDRSLNKLSRENLYEISFTRINRFGYEDPDVKKLGADIKTGFRNLIYDMVERIACIQYQMYLEQLPIRDDLSRKKFIHFKTLNPLTKMDHFRETNTYKKIIKNDFDALDFDEILHQHFNSPIYHKELDLEKTLVSK